MFLDRVDPRNRYQLNLQEVQFYHVINASPFNPNTVVKGGFEECKATNFLNQRGYPGLQAHSMFISA